MTGWVKRDCGPQPWGLELLGSLGTPHLCAVSGSSQAGRLYSRQGPLHAKSPGRMLRELQDPRGEEAKEALAEMAKCPLTGLCP
jgi:hypothetical protein